MCRFPIECGRSWLSKTSSFVTLRERVFTMCLFCHPFTRTRSMGYLLFPFLIISILCVVLDIFFVMSPRNVSSFYRIVCCNIDSSPLFPSVSLITLSASSQHPSYSLQHSPVEHEISNFKCLFHLCGYCEICTDILDIRYCIGFQHRF